MPDLADIIAAKLHELVLRNNGVSRGTADMRADAEIIASTIADERPIVWRSVKEISFRLKGLGQDLLIWCDGRAVVGHWADSGPHAGSWLDQAEEPVNPTHYTRIVEPAN